MQKKKKKSVCVREKYTLDQRISDIPLVSLDVYQFCDIGLQCCYGKFNDPLFLKDGRFDILEIGEMIRLN